MKEIIQKRTANMINNNDFKQLRVIFYLFIASLKKNQFKPASDEIY